MHYEEVFLGEDGAARLDCHLLDPEVATGVYKSLGPSCGKPTRTRL